MTRTTPRLIPLTSLGGLSLSVFLATAAILSGCGQEPEAAPVPQVQAPAVPASIPQAPIAPAAPGVAPVAAAPPQAGLPATPVAAPEVAETSPHKGASPPATQPVPDPGSAPPGAPEAPPGAPDAPPAAGNPPEAPADPPAAGTPEPGEDTPKAPGRVSGIRPPDPPAGRMTAQPAQRISGDLAVPQVEQVLKAQSQAVKSCYALGLVKDPAARGTATVRFTVGNGKVVKVVVSKNELGAIVKQCLVRRFKVFQFPAAKGASVFEKTYQFSPAK